MRFSCFSEIWQDDKEFGRQILNGANPTQLRRVTTYTDDLRQIGSQFKPNAQLGSDWEAEVYVRSLHIYTNFYAVDDLEKRNHTFVPITCSLSWIFTYKSTV